MPTVDGRLTRAAPTTSTRYMYHMPMAEDSGETADCYCLPSGQSRGGCQGQGSEDGEGEQVCRGVSTVDYSCELCCWRPHSPWGEGHGALCIGCLFLTHTHTHAHAHAHNTHTHTQCVESGTRVEEKDYPHTYNPSMALVGSTLVLPELACAGTIGT